MRSSYTCRAYLSHFLACLHTVVAHKLRMSALRHWQTQKKKYCDATAGQQHSKAPAALQKECHDGWWRFGFERISPITDVGVERSLRAVPRTTELFQVGVSGWRALG